MKPESMAIIEALLDDVQAEGDERTLLLGTLTGLVETILDIELHRPLDADTRALLKSAMQLHPELGKALAGEEATP